MEPISTSPSSAISGSVTVCGGARCTSARCQRVLRAFEVELTRRALGRNVRLSPSPCRGFCTAGPIAAVQPPGVLYCRVQPEDVPEIVEQTLIQGQIVQRLCYEEPEAFRSLASYRDMPLFSKQVRIALRNCGVIDPEQIDEYIARDGYAALAKVLGEMSPDDVIREMKDSGLRGRGGAGFSTGAKWEFCRRSPGAVKYVICNADEGDPGAFMDRSILESDPHSVIEGMTIAAYAIGASQGYIYCREEYPLAIDRLQIAIHQAHDLACWARTSAAPASPSTSKSRKAPGAFVCGEETALIASIEGRRGEPRPRPPFPAVAGLWGKPTNINNVKSYAMTPADHPPRAQWFGSIGTPEVAGHGHLCPDRQDQQHRPDRSPDGHPAGRHHLRRRRRRAPGQEVQGRADRRAAGRLPARHRAEHAGRFRLAGRSRRGDGLRRHDRGGRRHLHGRVRPVLPAVRRRRIVRQVRPVPRRRPAAAGSADADHRGPRDPQGSADHQGRLDQHDELVAVRPGPAHARPGAWPPCDSSRTSSSRTSTTSCAAPASARRWCGPAVSTPVPPASTRRPIWRWSPKAAMPKGWRSTASAIRSRWSAAAPARRSAKPSAGAARSTSRWRSAWSSGSWPTTNSRSRGRRSRSAPRPNARRRPNARWPSSAPARPA